MAVYIADRRLWLDAEGNVVEDGDPKAHSLLASGPGKKIPAAKARALGLMVDEPMPPEDAVQDNLTVDEPVEAPPDALAEQESEPVLHEANPEPPSRRRR